MTDKRKVAKLVGPRKFELFEETLRAPGAREILIKVVAVGLCHSEVPTYQGRSAIGRREDGSCYKNIHISYPSEIGHEPVGVVKEVGKGIREFKIGDYVGGFIKPSFASHIVTNVDKSKIMKIPSAVQEPKYCLPEPLMCVSNIVQAASPVFGDYLAVIGCGAMGLLCLSAISKSSAFEVIAMDLMVSRLDWAKKMGATHTLNPQESDVVKIVNQITQGRGVDVVIEITGTLSGLSLACDIIRVGRGKLLTPSLYDSPEIFDFGYQLMLKSPIVHSTHPWYSADYQEDMRKGVEGFVRRMLPLDQIITHEFSLENINDGFEMLENPTEDFIKGIVVP